MRLSMGTDDFLLDRFGLLRSIRVNGEYISFGKLFLLGYREAIREKIRGSGIT